MEIIIPLENELYNDYINRILNSRENVKDKENYQEQHHIIPKCMGGSNDKNNLIYLYAQEHYYAHKILALENPDNQNLQYAFWNMCQCCNEQRKHYNVSADEYALIRNICAQITSDRMKGENNPNYGKTPSKELREAQSKRMSGENNPNYGKTGTLSPNYNRHVSKETRMKMSNALKGKGIGRKASEETKKKLSESHKGAKAFKATAVKCIETGEIFLTIEEASKWCRINRNAIPKNLSGKQKTAGKHPITGEKLHWVCVE